MTKGKSPSSAEGKGPRTRASNGIMSPKPQRFTFSINHFHPRTKSFSETRKTLSVKLHPKNRSNSASYKVHLADIACTPKKTRSSPAKSPPASASTIDSDYLFNYPAPFKWNGPRPSIQEKIEEEVNDCIIKKSN